MTIRLLSKQKWRLAFQLLLLYFPLLLYVNLPSSARILTSMVQLIPNLLVSSGIATVIFFGFITATEWIQRQFVNWLGDDFLQDRGWFSLLITILIPVGLALLYILVFQPGLRAVFASIANLIPGFRVSNTPPAVLPEMAAYRQRVTNGFLVVIMLSAFYITNNARSFRQLKDVQLRAEQLEKEALLSQFEALKNQISPHFLFNSLSILTSMVHEDPDLSEQFIKRLSKSYRYILEQRDQNLVPLKTELDFIEAYTFLLKIRFDNKFSLEIDVPADSRQQGRIAPLTLQLLVENAVKHNRMSVREPLHIRIYCEDGSLIVANPIQVRDKPEPSTGIGLNNIKNRYAMLTDRPVLCSRQDSVFSVKIPLLS